MNTSCEASLEATGRFLCLVTSNSMASSTEYKRNGSAVAEATAIRPKNRHGARGAGLIGAGLAAVLVVGGGVSAFSALRTTPGLGSDDDAGIQIALFDPEADAVDADKHQRVRRHYSADSREAFNERMISAITAMDDPIVAVLPGSLDYAAVDKSQRLERPSALEDESKVALLRDALTNSVKQRAVRLALAEELSSQRKEYKRQLQVLASAQTDADDVTTGAIAPGAALAYASAPSAREALAEANDPFADVLSGQDEAEAGILLPDDDIPLPTFRPELPSIAKTTIEPPAIKQQPKTAYAKPDKPEKKTLFSWFGGGSKDLPGPGSKIAIYDITNQVVIMPNGERLEAHSGRGPTKDTPKYVHVSGRGSTPPNVYSLRMRESLFHGVEAIRMTPVGDAKMYGRNGFLTHSYLRRIPGDSAGCIAFADYKKFLNAFKRGQVSKIIVVPSMKELPAYMAML